MKKQFLVQILALLVALTLTFVGCDTQLYDQGETTSVGTTSIGTTSIAGGVLSPILPSDKAEIPALTQPEFDLSVIPAYSGTSYAPVNGNVPGFTSLQYTDTSYEYYSELDDLGRCGVAVACVGIDLMPTEDRGSISSVKPSGWQSVQYDIVDGKYLYNRCHLIGFQLTGENANKKNLITGTRYMNVDGMLPFENMIADHVTETENHVLFRVTPIFEGDNLVASGVIMEAYSVEDNGEGISFNVYVYNVQPGITINYATGTSALSGEKPGDNNEAPGTVGSTGKEMTYILNTNTKKFHYPTCSSAQDMKEENKETYTGDREDLIHQGYSPCGNCDP